MITKFVLIVIVMSADGMQYVDFVDKPSDTLRDCEEKKVLFLKQLKRKFDSSYFYFATCASPKGVQTMDV
jgi:hypothetical protein